MTRSVADSRSQFDDLTGTVADGPNFLLHYGHLKLTGWRLAAQPQGAPHVTPVSPPNFIRAHDSTGSFNSTSISSTGALLKFRSFFFGCERDTDFVPVPCALRVTGFNATGHAQHKIGSIDVEYLYGAPGANGQAPMQQITGDTLRNLTVSSYYVFETVPAGASTFKPRLVLDNVDYVYYQTV